MSRAIEARALGKRYLVGAHSASYLTLRETLSSAIQHRRKAPSTHLWALKDIDFTADEGEVVGIIGRNGAGKTTLLKLLTRITEPTVGVSRTRGRVGALLEVGTGFHPELTARENIYLNGAILGMRKSEIDRKFDQIVTFAEMAAFIDTPVKRYSTGMRARLAFSVAAHLEPDILIVDEVLAVGDASFQRKSLGRLDDVATEGRTVLFVSHNMLAIESLCTRAIWIEGGKIHSDGQPRQVVSEYLQSSFTDLTDQTWADRAAAPGNDRVRLRRARVRREDSGSGAITTRTPVDIEFEYWNLHPGASLNVRFNMYNGQGILVFSATPVYDQHRINRPLPSGLFRDICHIPGDLLNDGVHRVDLLFVDDQTLVHNENDVLVFEVRDVLDHRGSWYGEWPGTVRPAFEWSHEVVDQEPVRRSEQRR